MTTRIGRLVKDIQYSADLSIEQVAEKIGYTRPHLNKLMKKGDSKKVYDALQAEFGEILQSVIQAQNKTTATETAQKSTNADKPRPNAHKLTTATKAPDFGMKPSNGNSEATIRNQSDAIKTLAGTNQSQQEVISKLTDLVTKLVKK